MKIFDKEGYKNKGRLLGWGSGPNADWKIMFGVFVSALIVIVVFYESMTGEFGAETNITTQSPIDINTIKSTAEQYKAKKATFETLLKAEETLSDPSK